EKLLLLARKEEIIVITHYVNPELFAYITMQQVEAAGVWVNQMEAQLPTHCKPDQKLEHYAPEQYVIVRFWPWQRDKLLRGLVKLCQQGEYLVWAMDYGITIQCGAKDLWQLPANLCEKSLDIRWGGVAGVAPLNSTTWSKLAVGVLSNRLEEAAQLIYRTRTCGKEHSFGELCIKSKRQEEPLLDAASYLLEKHYAMRQDRADLSIDYRQAYDIKLAELNDADIRSSPRAQMVLQLMWKQRKPSEKPALKARSLACPSMQPGRLDTLLQACKMPSIPDSAKRLSKVTTRNASTIDTALCHGSFNGSSVSVSSRDSYCSADGFESAEEQPKAAQRNSRNILEFYRRPVIAPQRKPQENQAAAASRENLDRNCNEYRAQAAATMQKTVDRKYGAQVPTAMEKTLDFKEKPFHSVDASSVEKSQVLANNQHAAKTVPTLAFSMDSKHTPLVLAHSQKPVLPIDDISKSLICKDVQRVMTEMNIESPLPTQRYAWPHLMHGNSCILVDGAGRGRSWCYLPALCSRVMRNLQVAPIDAGPLAVLLADSVASAQHLFHHCQNLMRCYETLVPKVINTHAHPAAEIPLMLLNSCGILITTAAQLQQLLQPAGLQLINPRRLKYFVLDDYDRMRGELPELLPTISGLNLARLQLILVAQHWHSRDFLELYQQLAIGDPLLLFGDFLNAAIYGGLKLGVVLLRSDKKIARLIEYLTVQSRSSQRRTAIYCRHEVELATLKVALTAAGRKCIGASEVANQVSHELLLLTDASFPCRNLELMVHYSLPDTWTKFAQRFRGFSENIANCLSPRKQLERQHIVSYVMLDESNSNELPRLLEFLHANDFQLDKQIYQMVSSCRRLTDRIRAFCPQMLSHGECSRQMSCHHRHFTVEGDFRRSRDEALCQSELLVRGRLLKIYSPSRFAVMAESYSCDGVRWQDAANLSKLRRLSTELYIHMSLGQQTRVQQELSISDVCVLRQSSRYQRVRVVDLCDRRLVTVQQMDEGTQQLKVKRTELLDCEERFKSEPALAMDVQLLGVLPRAGEGDWQPEANRWVNEALGALQGNQQLQFDVAFSMFGKTYVKELTVLQECPTLRTTVKVLQLKQELQRQGFAQQDEKTVAKLCQLHAVWLAEQLKADEARKKIAVDGSTRKSVEQMPEKHEETLLRASSKTKETDLEKEAAEETLDDSDGIFFECETGANASQQSSAGMVKNFLSAVQGYFLRKNRVDLLKTVDQKALEVAEAINTSTAAPAESTETGSMSAFLDVLMQDMCSLDDSLKHSASQFVQDLFDSESPPNRNREQQQEITERVPAGVAVQQGNAIFCGAVAGNAVRPKVRWHQTLMQIELIFEQQVPQYELLHERNVLIYQVSDVSPPQRCILNLLGEVSVISQQQHGYQLHVKLAKQGLHMFWPTLLSSLAAQQHCHWLVYDTERGGTPPQDMGRVNWLRY
ncbi:hypothetical protein KR222_005125, partial [Zaprionus bogoriensis]